LSKSLYQSLRCRPRAFLLRLAFGFGCSPGGWEDDNIVPYSLLTFWRPSSL
jgi:hypothetical protein